MKTFKNLYLQIISFENVYAAYLKARKGKRYRDYTLDFTNDVETELWSIINDLNQKTYKPGPYHTFRIYEPKERLISAATFRDRVVHHALCNVIEPIYDRTFINDSYACRIGKGTHKAIFRSWEFMRKNSHVLKCDIRKYFLSIDHDVLMAIIRRKIRCNDTLWLIKLIIDHGNVVSKIKGKGLPIGNLTSQFFANLYLNELDYFIKQKLKVHYYIRYMDDFIIFNNKKVFLHDCLKKIRTFLDELKLELKPGKSEIFPVKNGFEFLGFFNKLDRVKVKKEGVRRFIKRLRRMRWQFRNGLISINKISESVRCWSAHASYANSYMLRRKIMRNFVINRGTG